MANEVARSAWGNRDTGSSIRYEGQKVLEALKNISNFTPHRPKIARRIISSNGIASPISFQIRNRSADSLDEARPGVRIHVIVQCISSRKLGLQLALLVESEYESNMYISASLPRGFSIHFHQAIVLTTQQRNYTAT